MRCTLLPDCCGLKGLRTSTHSPNSGRLSPTDARDVSRRKQNAARSNITCMYLLFSCRSIIVRAMRPIALWKKLGYVQKDNFDSTIIGRLQSRSTLPMLPVLGKEQD